MNFKNFILSLGAFMITLTAVAGEGMWLPMMLNRTYDDMVEHGLQLSPEELYSINQSSLKDAIVSMGNGFCTGEIISAEGLLLTNHHCGYDYVRGHSTVEANYLRDGFWAMDRSQELPNTGLFVRFLVRMDDVTPQISAVLNDAMSEEERNAAIREKSAELVEQATAENDYKAEVKTFFHGNEFYLFIYEIYNDVRLVGAPPSSIGKFGGDTDNWMWPRHTGDFTMFRVYQGPDGKPAEYSQDNVPLQAKHHLPISMKEREEGDYAMIFGYPGSTDRYLSSFGVEEAVELHHPAVVEVRDLKLSIMREAMDADEAVDIMLASDYASTANYWKYYIGQTEQLVNNGVYDKKKAQEDAFAAWVNADETRKAKYGETLELLKNGYESKAPYVVGDVYALEAGLIGSQSILHAFRVNRALQRYATLEEGEQRDGMKAALLANDEEHYAEMHVPTDRRLMGSLLQLYYENVTADQHPAFFSMVVEEFDGDFTAFADSAFESSLFTSTERLEAWLENPVDSIRENDLLTLASTDLYNIYIGTGQDRGTADEDLARGYRLWTAGIREMNPGRDFAPDANSTMRVTYGNVLSYEPRDGVKYNFYTTLEGVMEKMDNDDREFIVPNKLAELYLNKDYGRYANSNGELPVGFISNNDITGGNSGSPVINGNGELIGCAFDGNWEAMSGDIFFEKDLQRTISVDIRYVLFIVDKYAGAGHLVDEMTLVYPKKKKFLGIF